VVVDLMFALPLWLLAFVLNAWLMGTALLGIRIARRYLLPRLGLRYDDAYYAAALVQSAMLLYSLVAALTAVGVWQRYSQVSDVVSSEATAIVSLWHDIGGYPQAERDAGRAILRGYTDQVIREAWPQQRRGRVPSEGVAWMDRLRERLFAFEPVTEGQKILHAETLRQFSQLVQARRQRLASVEAALPSIMWFVLLPGAMGCIVLCLFFHVGHPALQTGLLLGLAGFLAMVLFVIIAMDRPFVGDLGIGPESYRLVFDHHMRQ
jgi:hypothetical protein